ncbi:DUF2252 domain-containing protein [Mucilaginibacter xinganensis]|uniref:DUF2252 domain-containing protein n=1 Tax=Mucilaginibacter xinganensis TaxID=1234841 RepID=A0A223NQA1_9SPHI|nr:DUF2252 family protein [Mucilaginibacter xinganensis]ASU32079.1 hypothetical protein MuYL_0176 [Mucilaginibacter xinganensis]
MSTISERLKLFNQHLLPDMVQLKYEAMTDNAFRYYRGTCHLFYEDLAAVKKFPDSPLTWICGDMHLENYGSYKADNKLVYFDLNDFDESILAPCLWEAARLVTSIFIAFDTLDIEPEKADKMARLFIKTYAATLVRGKATSIDPRTAKGIVCDFLSSAAGSKYTDILKKRTDKKKNKVVLSLSDERQFKIKKPLRLALMGHIQQWIEQSSDSPYNYKVKDAVFRLAGTGSIGQKRYLFLLKSTNTRNKYLLVDMKQSRPSSLAPYVTATQPAWPSEAERIIAVQHRMQNVSASLLSSTLFHDEPYVLQELQPVKDTIKFKLIRDQYRDIYQVIDDMAALTASAQLRSGGMNGSATIDELIAFGSNANWQQALLGYCFKYGMKIKADYRQYLSDYNDGVFNQSSSQVITND